MNFDSLSVSPIVLLNTTTYFADNPDESLGEIDTSQEDEQDDSQEATAEENNHEPAEMETEVESESKPEPDEKKSPIKQKEEPDEKKSPIKQKETTKIIEEQPSEEVKILTGLHIQTKLETKRFKVHDIKAFLEYLKSPFIQSQSTFCACG